MMDDNLSLSSQENYRRLYLSSVHGHYECAMVKSWLSQHYCQFYMLVIIKFIDPNSYDHPLSHRIHVCYILYMVTFTINIPLMLAYIPYMDPMGMYNSPIF